MLTSGGYSPIPISGLSNGQSAARFFWLARATSPHQSLFSIHRCAPVVLALTREFATDFVTGTKVDRFCSIEVVRNANVIDAFDRHPARQRLTLIITLFFYPLAVGRKSA